VDLSTAEENSIEIESILLSGLSERLITICADFPFCDSPFVACLLTDLTWEDGSAWLTPGSCVSALGFAGFA
jgi:hypothetical protein